MEFGKMTLHVQQSEPEQEKWVETCTWKIGSDLIEVYAFKSKDMYIPYDETKGVMAAPLELSKSEILSDCVDHILDDKGYCFCIAIQKSLVKKSKKYRTERVYLGMQKYDCDMDGNLIRKFAIKDMDSIDRDAIEDGSSVSILYEFKQTVTVPDVPLEKITLKFSSNHDILCSCDACMAHSRKTPSYRQKRAEEIVLMESEIARLRKYIRDFQFYT